MTKWQASAPSNIALIKYMGKTDSSANRPTNSSLSYTLSHLRSVVELELLTGASQDRWEPLTQVVDRTLPKLKLSEKGAGRFLQHLGRMKAHFGFDGSFVVRSANDFPSDCGLASSASSFAALTKVALEALPALTGKPAPTISEAADWSRQGSGSSCRSFFAPWGLWTAQGIGTAPELSTEELLHQVIIVDDEVKAVSSSSAHLRVASSLLFRGRPERAEERLQGLLRALRSDDWREAFEISWAEFWDMHALFETAQPSFGYMTPGSLEALRYIRAQTWDKSNDGPLVTMDAGPNIHLLYRKSAASRKQAEELASGLRERFQVLSNLGSRQ